MKRIIGWTLLISFLLAVFLLPLLSGRESFKEWALDMVIALGISSLIAAFLIFCFWLIGRYD